MNSDIKYKSIQQVILLFSDAKKAHQYIGKNIWPDGVVNCPHCFNDTVYIFKDGIRYKCKKCLKQFKSTTGTMMENSKMPLCNWIVAMQFILNKKGISSVDLGKQLGITQKTAWNMMHKIRVSMAGNSDEMLSGTVEMDEAFIGGKSQFKHKKKRMRYKPGRSWSDKVPVFGLVQRNSMDSHGRFIPSRIKAFVMGNVEMLTITKAVRQHVKIGSNLMGDGFTAYRVLDKQYNLKCVDHGSGWYVDGDTHTNTIEGFWSQLKKGLKGVYHQVSKKHLQKYVDEFVFKYNNRNLDTQEQIECIIRNMPCQVNKAA